MKCSCCVVELPFKVSASNHQLKVCVSTQILSNEHYPYDHCL